MNLCCNKAQKVIRSKEWEPRHGMKFVETDDIFIHCRVTAQYLDTTWLELHFRIATQDAASQLVVARLIEQFMWSCEVPITCGICVFRGSELLPGEFSNAGLRSSLVRRFLPSCTHIMINGNVQLVIWRPIVWIGPRVVAHMHLS